jgi:hypothetical protein
MFERSQVIVSAWRLAVLTKGLVVGFLNPTMEWKEYLVIGYITTFHILSMHYSLIPS